MCPEGHATFHARSDRAAEDRIHDGIPGFKHVRRQRHPRTRKLVRRHQRTSLTLARAVAYPPARSADRLLRPGLQRSARPALSSRRQSVRLRQNAEADAARRGFRELKRNSTSDLSRMSRESRIHTVRQQVALRGVSHSRKPRRAAPASSSQRKPMHGLSASQKSPAG